MSKIAIAPSRHSLGIRPEQNRSDSKGALFAHESNMDRVEAVVGFDLGRGPYQTKAWVIICARPSIGNLRN